MNIQELKDIDGDGYYDDFDAFFSSVQTDTILRIQANGKYYKLRVGEKGVQMDDLTFNGDDEYLMCEVLYTTDESAKAHEEYPIAYVGHIDLYHIYKGREDSKLLGLDQPGVQQGEPVGSLERTVCLIP